MATSKIQEQQNDRDAGTERQHPISERQHPISERQLTVSELVSITRSLLEEALPEVTFRGEIGEVRSGKTGHFYLTVKDATAQVAVVMWATVAVRSRVKLTPGLEVVIAGHPTVYGQRGSLQFVVHRIAEAGAGALQKKFLELKAKLEQEGLFASSRKRRLPCLPRTVGVVTSANGAVIHDILHRVAERFPSVQVTLIDVRVQGEGSAEDIARAIEQFNRLKPLVDVLIVGRGGGSIEDLWAFNEERVVRAVYASAIPIVSAVGHETDVTLCDFVADLRAPTPTAAAEMVVPRRDELLRRLTGLEHRLLDPERILAPLEQRLDEVAMRLERGVALALERGLNAVRYGEQRLRALQPRQLLQQAQQRILQSSTRLQLAASAALQRRRAELLHHAARLSAVNPRAVLTRGYAVVSVGERAVRNANEVHGGDTVKILLGVGEISATVR